MDNFLKSKCALISCYVPIGFCNYKKENLKMDFDINTFIATFGIWNFVPVAITILVQIAFSEAVYSDAQIIK